MFKYENSVMLHEARKAKHQPNIILQIVIFIAVFFASQIIAGIVLAIPVVPRLLMNEEFMAMVMSGNIASPDEYTSLMFEVMPNIALLNLYGTIITIACVIIYIKFIEGRSLISAGFAKKGGFKSYGKGIVIGAVMMAATVALAVAFGGVKLSSLNMNISMPIIMAFFLGYLIQGASEEILCRGYFMVSCANRVNNTIAVILSSVVFAAMHLANPGMTALAFLNISLFGIFAGFYILRTDDIWGACAIHSIWNFVQGNVFGISVSGTGMQESFFTAESITGSGIINGGEFGIEGGICTTIVLGIAIVLVLLIPQRERPVIIDDEPVPAQRNDNELWNVYK